MVVTHTSSHVFSNSTLVQILDDLCVRFIINLPTEEMHSVERVCFQIEEAQWYYEDFVRGHNPNLPTLNLRSFASKIFQHCPSLHEWKDSHEQAMNQFIEYKSRVPVRGAILLNPELDQCVLVRGMKSSASWSFPRGKINQDEKDDVCAIREVLEETGFDASHLIHSDWYIEQSIRNQSIRLYIIPGVPLDTQFAPRTRNEIGTIQWHYLSDLPTFSKRKVNGEAPKMGKFYMVAPFLPQLRKWIQKDGSQWKLEQSAHAVDIPLPTDDEHYEQKEQDGVNLLTTYPHTEPISAYQDSSASLRSLLGIHAESAPDPIASQADAAAKLKSLLSIGSNPESAQPSSMSTNGQILLSLLQNGPSAKKTDLTIPSNTAAQPPITSTQGAPVVPPHSTVSIHKPVTPLHNPPVAQPPALYTSPNYKSSNASQATPAKTIGSYSHMPGSTNALLAELQSSAPAKPAVMTEQAAALLKTLNSNNSLQKQQAISTPSSSDVHIPTPHQVPETQQKLPLLSILKGSSTTAPVQQVNTVPITPVSPVVQPHVPQHQPPHQTPLRHQTPPMTASAKASMTSSASRSPAARRDHHKNSPTSPRNHRANNRSIKNVDFPKPTPATRPTPVAPTKEAPPMLQVPQKHTTAPLEPYINSPAGVPLNAVSPVLARTGPMFDRRETANQEQQQTLLAIFKKPSVSTLKSDFKPATAIAPSVSSPIESNASASAKLLAAVKKVQNQQMPSMRTGGGVSLSQALSDGAASSSRSSLTPGGAVAFANDAFLKSYLENVAKGAGK